MKFSLGHVLGLIDATVLNPWISILISIGLQLLRESKVLVQPATDSFWGYHISSLPSLQSKVLKLVVAGILLRANRWLSARARNNGTKAKFVWDEEIIVVTGGAGGIGAEAAQKFAERGSKVVVLDVLPLTYSASANLSYYECDLTNLDKVESVAARIRKDIGNPTCIVANAGICRGKPILHASKRDVELTFGVNNLGLLWTAKAFLPAMAERNHGHFLIVASQTGYLATAGVADYAATKSAAIAIYEGLQTELKHVHKAPAVRISVLNPSAVNTKMFDGIKSPSNFMMPRLSAADVGAVICNMIWSGQAQNLMVPAFAYISAPTRCLPDWMRIAMQDGGAEVMTELTPHQPLN